MIAANTLTHVDKHVDMLREIAATRDIYKFLDPGPLADVYKPLVGWRTPSTELRGEASRVS